MNVNTLIEILSALPGDTVVKSYDCNGTPPWRDDAPREIRIAYNPGRGVKIFANHDEAIIIDGDYHSDMYEGIEALKALRK